MTVPPAAIGDDGSVPGGTDRHRTEREGRRLCLESVFEADFGQRTARDVLAQRTLGWVAR
jgi:hypothetical protein